MADKRLYIEFCEDMKLYERYWITELPDGSFQAEDEYHAIVKVKELDWSHQQELIDAYLREYKKTGEDYLGFLLLKATAPYARKFLAALE